MKNQSFNYNTADDAVRGLDLSSETILITGCASGLGLETMRALSQRGASIVALARTRAAAERALSAAGAHGVPIACDLADLTSITKAIEDVRGLGKKLDAIVASAGVVGGKSLVKTHGIELQFQVNYLAHFALINGLLDVLQDGNGRIAIVSSDAAVKQAPKEGIRFDDLSGDRSYSPFAFYGQSKLACAIYAKELARRVAPRKIDVNSVHPGAVRGTALNRSLGFPLNLVLKVASLFMKSVAEGAATQTFLAANPAARGITGQYWTDCRVSKGPAYLEDAAMAARLWEVSSKLVARG
jgi:WW domain-containing oxidoreductase